MLLITFPRPSFTTCLHSRLFQIFDISPQPTSFLHFFRLVPVLQIKNQKREGFFFIVGILPITLPPSSWQCHVAGYQIKCLLPPP